MANYCQKLYERGFFMDTKKAVWIMAVCGTVTAGLLAAPEAVLNAIPTATIVNVERVEQSDSISLSGTIMKNTRDGTFSVQVYVPEQDISKVTAGQTAEITGNAFPGITYSGEVEKISDIASKIQTGNVQKTAVEVKIKINEPYGELKHGYTAAVKLITSQPGIMTVLPYEAVNQDDAGEFVYIFSGGRAYKRYIETGREFSSGVELKTRINESEKIVTVDELAENGATVKISDKGGKEND